MKIAIGSDQWGFDFKKMIIEEYGSKGHEFVDVGTFSKDPVSYPEIAYAVSKKVSEGECERGILICGTGVGMALTANKVKGAYAAVCHDVYSTERSILSNNANIMCMGALVIGPQTAMRLTDLWLKLEFDTECASAKKVAKIYEIEEGTLEVE